MSIVELRDWAAAHDAEVQWTPTVDGVHVTVRLAPDVFVASGPDAETAAGEVLAVARLVVGDDREAPEAA
jgi:hypothetical protein